MLFSRQTVLLITLVTLLAGVYLLTYSGLIESGDTLRFLDAVTSQARYGDWLLDEAMWFHAPDNILPDQLYPLQPYDVEESFNLTLALPLYGLAQLLPGLGTVHTVWLFNVIVSAAACGVIFHLAIKAGYSSETAILAALALGLGTALWPYSKSFFREPLVLLFLLLAATFIEHWRSCTRRWWFAALAGLSFLGAVLTKSTAIFALPAFVVLSLPQFSFSIFAKPVLRRLLDIAFAAALLFPLALIYIEAFRGPMLSLIELLPFGATIQAHLIPEALHTYFLSIGGSIWGTSPIVLLAIPGTWLLRKEGKHRLIWGWLGVVWLFAVGHALFSGDFWFGGESWPPRFLIPVLPFLILAALPVFDRLARSPRPKILLLTALSLLIYSLWIQFNGVALSWSRYIAVLPPEAGGLSEWGGGLNVVSYLRWVLLPSQWAQLGFNFAWVRVELHGWALALLLIVLISAILLWRISRSVEIRPRLKNGALALPVICIVTIFLGLRALHDFDLTYWSDKPALQEALASASEQSQQGGVLLTADNTYWRFFANHNQNIWPRVIIMPLAPGERASEKETPVVSSENPDALLNAASIRVIHHLADHHERLWLLASNSPFIPWSVRPMEQFLAQHYYFLRVVPTPTNDPTVRLIEFSLIEAPPRFDFRGPDFLSDLRYGDAISLTGFSLPRGETYQPGAILPLTLYWQAQQPVDRNYVVAWFLADAAGQVAAQGADSQPVFDFAPTSAWIVGEPVQDNRALKIPDALPSGDYQLWVVMYLPEEGIRLNVNGSTALENNIGMLPVTIRILSQPE